ncbi:MAG TPA: S8 family serine peptidase [Candidatus Dormibacteraeota bacterium]|nr:S8 family serine peptidase [Candidatus Dormibacteraeota bacterium]
MIPAVQSERHRGRVAHPLAILALLATAHFPSLGLAQSLISDKPSAFVAASRPPAFVPDQLLVKFNPSSTREQMERAASEMGATFVELVTPDGLAKVRFNAGANIVDVLKSWSHRGDIEYAVPNLIAHSFFVPNDSTIARFDLAWNLRQIGAFDAWDVVTGDPSVVLAIVDTGIAFEDHAVPGYELPFIKPGVTMYRQSPELPGPFLPGWDFVNNDAHPNDDNGHGTSVATIAAGAANNTAGSAGVAFGVTLLPVKVIDHEDNAESDNIVKGIRFAADQGADIINLSLGYPPLSLLRALGFSDSTLAALFNPLKDAVRYAQRRGSILVGATGNFDFDEVSFPAGLPGVIAVGATNVDMSRSSYSSYGPTLDFMAPGGDFTELNGDHVQDGVAVMSIKPFRSTGSLANPDSFNVFIFFGTSGASPHVAGAVALLMSLGVRNQNSIEKALRETAINPFGTTGVFDSTYGYGLIQIDKAVRAVGRRGKKGHPLGRGSKDGFEAHVVSRNPVSQEVAISFQTASPGPVTARVFDVRGALVRTLLTNSAQPGPYLVRWDGRDDRGVAVPTGVYFFRIETLEGQSSHKVAFLR